MKEIRIEQRLECLYKNTADNFSIQNFNLYNRRAMEKNYKKLKHLGQGSFGTVFLVQDNSGQKFALKRVQMNPFSGDDALKQIKVMRSVIHQNLIRVYDSTYNEDTEQLEIIMEYCEGGDLLHYFADNKKVLQTSQILKIVRQIVKGFIALNVKGIMHRDLKPENVLIKKQMTGNLIKIADFGCARNLTADQISKIDHFTLATGTAIYASPEQLQNQPYSSKCDVWSGGCLLYLLAFGSHPFQDSSADKTLLKIKNSTQGKQIALPPINSTIRELLKIMLVYEDKERATWRQLWLHRFFNSKVNSMVNFMTYLSSVSNIANHIIKEFWALRKSVNMTQTKSEVFAYFIVKFQYTNVIMAREIAQCNPRYDYLFPEGAYCPLPDNQNKLIDSIKFQVSSSGNYFDKIKQSLIGKQSYNIIQQKQMKRKSNFADLDHSIRAAYKILIEALPSLQKMEKTSGQNGGAGLDFVWLVMARWLNFETWFSYEKKPRIEDIIIESKSNNKNIFKQIQSELERYNRGVVE